MQKWASENGLVLNTKKTKLIQLSKHSEQNIPLDEDLVALKVDSARNLGITFDHNLKWSKHITGQIKECYKRFFTLKQFCKEYLAEHRYFNIRRTLVISLILSKLYYCSSLFQTINKTDEKSMHRLIKTACSIIFQRYTYKSDISKANILLSKQQTIYTILNLANRVSINSCPEYLQVLRHEFSRTNRSSNTLQLAYPPIKTHIDTFPYNSADNFNKLPNSICKLFNTPSFKHKLYTHLNTAT